MGVGVEALLEGVGLEAGLLRVAREVGGRERLLVAEELLVHLPVLALVAGALGGAGRAEGVGVDRLQRQVAHHVEDLAGLHVLTLDLRQRLLGVAAAERALEVRELHQHQAGAGAALGVGVGHAEVEGFGGDGRRRAGGLSRALQQGLDLLQIALHGADPGLERLDLLPERLQIVRALRRDHGGGQQRGGQRGHDRTTNAHERHLPMGSSP